MDTSNFGTGGDKERNNFRDIGYLCWSDIKKNDIKPHKTEYWLFPKIGNWEAFVRRVSLICSLIIQATQGLHSRRHVLSVDEKTGIQALERIEAKAPQSKGGHRRKEFEYKRNGTTCLIAAFDVGKGNIANQRIHPTRREEDFF